MGSGPPIKYHVPAPSATTQPVGLPAGRTLIGIQIGNVSILLFYPDGREYSTENSGRKGCHVAKWPSISANWVLTNH